MCVGAVCTMWIAMRKGEFAEELAMAGQETYKTDCDKGRP